MEKFYMRQ